MSSGDQSVHDRRMLNLKLEVPRQRIKLLMRPRLLQRLSTGDNLAAPLCLLTASAGYGKTTILAQWSESLTLSGRHVAWLTLDEADGDPRLFLSAVIFAISRAGFNVGQLVPHAEQGLIDLTPDTCLSLLADRLELARANAAGAAHAEAPLVLILDDYHRASNPVLDGLLLKMVLSLQGTTALVVSTRFRPDIGVPNLIASGLACELTTDALRLTEEEMRELLRDDIAQAHVADIIETTEGWPVALQLTRLIARGSPHGALPAGCVSIRGGYLSTYLTERVMRTLSPETVDFLMETSIVEKFSLDLADAVRGRRDSDRLLEALEPLQSLLTPLASENGWYRYHHLFQDHLRRLLVELRPADVPALHLRASAWFEARGHVLESVFHARKAGAFDVCARLIEQAGGWRLILYGGINHLRTLLNLVPPAERLRYPRVLISEAYLHLKDGKIFAARSLLELATSAAPVPENQPELPRWLPRAAAADPVGCDTAVIGLLLEGYQDNWLGKKLLGVVGHIRAKLPADDAVTHGTVQCVEAIALLRLGMLRQAGERARTAMGFMRAAQTPLGINYCLIHMGVAALYQGDLPAASAHLQRAQELAEENLGSDGGLKQIADILQQSVELWRSGRSTEISALPRRFMQAAGEQDGWLDIYAANLDARFEAAKDAGCDADVQHVLDDGLAVLRVRPIDRLQPIIQARRLQRAIARGRSLEAKRLAEDLALVLPVGCWREAPETWRPLQDAGFALVLFFTKADPARALAIASDLIDCAEAMGAGIFLVRALVQRARLRRHLGEPLPASEDFSRALRLAWPSGMMRPFLEAGGSADLLALFSGPAGDARQALFVRDLLAAANALPPAPAPTSKLSARELEVVRQLSLGMTNKEIGCSLKMTEHTVKFHIRNIFSKLGVERRAHAITLFRRMTEMAWAEEPAGEGR